MWKFILGIFAWWSAGWRDDPGDRVAVKARRTDAREMTPLARQARLRAGAF